MRKISIRSSKEGDILARDIVTDEGHILLRSGITLTPDLRSLLLRRNIDTIFIDDDRTEDILPEETLNEETRENVIRKVRYMMNQMSSNANNDHPAASAQLGEVFQFVYQKIMEDISTQTNQLVNLADLYIKDDYLLNQSINTSAVSIVIGMSMNYNETKLKELCLGALMSDIGMTMLDRSIWDKSSPLTSEDWAELRSHPEIGYQLLLKQQGVSVAAALCARQHHERYDGRGYPQGLKGNEIHEYAQIIAIANVYSALTSTRKYRQRYTPSEAIEYMFAMGDRQFSLDMLKKFTAQIAIYPVTSTVLLSTGQTAVVSEVVPALVTRPVVRLIKEADGSDIVKFQEIDLSKELNVTIIDML